MERPNSKALDSIEELISLIENAESTITSMKQELGFIVSRLSSIIPDKAELLDVVNYLYWLVPEVSPLALAECMAGEAKPHLLQPYIKPFSSGSCLGCASSIEVLSRVQLKKLTISVRKADRKAGLRSELAECLEDCRYCESCQETRRSQRRDKRDREASLQIAQQRARIAELRSMPYREYLRTPEWQATRTHQLRRAGYACQVCNAKGGLLNVHHRTYERRGNEAQEDLVVLCRGCHELFHREGKLAHH